MAKTIVISRRYSRVNQFTAVNKKTGKYIHDILSCDVDGFSLHDNEYPCAIIKNVVIVKNNIHTQTRYLQCKSIEFNMEFEEITQEQYNFIRGSNV